MSNVDIAVGRLHRYFVFELLDVELGPGFALVDQADLHVARDVHAFAHFQIDQHAGVGAGHILVVDRGDDAVDNLRIARQGRPPGPG